MTAELHSAFWLLGLEAIVVSVECGCREDASLAHGRAEATAQQLYQDVASAAESGWDFSSRWLEDAADLATIRTTRIVPVEINTFLWHLEHVLSKLLAAAGDTEQAHQVQHVLASQLHPVRFIAVVVHWQLSCIAAVLVPPFSDC